MVDQRRHLRLQRFSDGAVQVRPEFYKQGQVELARRLHRRIRQHGPQHGTKSADPAANFGVVWGCKPPELLITETFASHDRGVADTNTTTPTSKKRTDSTGSGTTGSPYAPADQSLNQVRVPQGSLFVELYCPRSPSGSAPTNNLSGTSPSDLYTYDSASGLWKLDLGRMTPIPSTNGMYYPVWRLVLTKSRFPGDDPSGNSSIYGRLNGLYGLIAKPDSSSLETEQYRGDPTPGQFSLIPVPPIQNCRSTGSCGLLGQNCLNPAGVTYGSKAVPVAPTGGVNNPLPPNTHYDGDKIYYNLNLKSGTQPLLAGDQYAIVAPRLVTYFGTAKGSLGTLGPQTINLGGPTYINSTGAGLFPPVGTQIKTPLVIIAAGTPPTSWKSHPNGIGVNVSEPLFSNRSIIPSRRSSGLRPTE